MGVAHLAEGDLLPRVCRLPCPPHPQTPPKLTHTSTVPGGRGTGAQRPPAVLWGNFCGSSCGTSPEITADHPGLRSFSCPLLRAAQALSQIPVKNHNTPHSQQTPRGVACPPCPLRQSGQGPFGATAGIYTYLSMRVKTFLLLGNLHLSVILPFVWCPRPTLLGPVTPGLSPQPTGPTYTGKPGCPGQGHGQAVATVIAGTWGLLQ